MKSGRFPPLVLSVVFAVVLVLSALLWRHIQRVANIRPAGGERGGQLSPSGPPIPFVAKESKSEEKARDHASPPRINGEVLDDHSSPTLHDDAGAGHALYNDGERNRLADLADQFRRGSLEAKEAVAREMILDGSSEVVAIFLEELQSESDLNIVERLVRTLQGLENHAAWSGLAPFLTNSQNHVILAEAQNALGRISSQDSVTALLALLESELSDWQRANVLTALAQTRNAAAVSLMLEAALSTTDDHYLEVAASALSAIGTPEAIYGLAQLIEERGVTNASNPLSSALAQTRSKTALPALVTLFTTSANPLVKNATARALADAQQQLGGIGFDALLQRYASPERQGK